MNLTKYLVLAFMFIGSVAGGGGKLKFFGFKGPHGGFAAVKWRKPKLFGGHGLGGGLGHVGFGGGGGGFHSEGYEHHEYHESHHSSGSSFGGGAFGGAGGWLGK